MFIFINFCKKILRLKYKLLLVLIGYNIMKQKMSFRLKTIRKII